LRSAEPRGSWTIFVAGRGAQQSAGGAIPTWNRWFSSFTDSGARTSNNPRQAVNLRGRCPVSPFGPDRPSRPRLGRIGRRRSGTAIREIAVPPLRMEVASARRRSKLGSRPSHFARCDSDCVRARARGASWAPTSCLHRIRRGDRAALPRFVVSVAEVRDHGRSLRLLHRPWHRRTLSCRSRDGRRHVRGPRW
jgi:hypothetical protein